MKNKVKNINYGGQSKFFMLKISRNIIAQFYPNGQSSFLPF